MRSFKLLTLILASIILLQISSSAQSNEKLAARASNAVPDPAAESHVRYIFENSKFTTPLQEVEFDGEGRGQFKFQRKDEDEVVNKLQVPPKVLSQIQSLFDELKFLSSDENYQHKKDFSHLGTMTIGYARDGKERTVKFNYTDNQAMNRLIEIFRNIATQETRVFEVETILANDPISMPAQLRMLESEMKSKRIADPERFTPILENLKSDEAIPLIARNHAERLIQMIKKGK